MLEDFPFHIIAIHLPCKAKKQTDSPYGIISSLFISILLWFNAAENPESFFWALPWQTWVSLEVNTGGGREEGRGWPSLTTGVL